MRKILLRAAAALTLLVVVLNWTYGRLPSEPKPGGSFIQIGKLRVHYVERPGSGSPVLLIHGLPGTAADFERVAPLLGGHRTIAIDRPGFGYSSGGYVSFERQLSTISELLVRLHVQRPVIVGHSYGGTIALGLAERHPSEVGGLVLVDAAAGGTKLGAFDMAQAHLVSFLQLPVIHQVANATFAQLLDTVSVNQGDAKAFHPLPVDAAHRRRLLAINMTRGNLEAFAAEQLHANETIATVDRALGSITAPSIVIEGAGDELVKPQHARKLAGELPGSSLQMLSGGHMQPYAHPAAIAAAVQALEGGPAVRP